MKTFTQHTMVIAILTLCFSTSLTLSIRTLETDPSIREKACSKAGNDLYLKANYTSLDDYSKGFGDKNKSLDFIINLLLKGGYEGYSEFFIYFLGYLIMLVFGIISIFVVIPVLWCCCCCKCCVFNQDKMPRSCAVVVFTVLFFTGIIAVSVVGYFKSHDFVKHFNGSSCALFTFFDHTLKGENKTELPKWAGLSNMPEMVIKINQSLNQINADSDKIFNSPSYTDGVIKLKKTYSSKTTTTIPSNNGKGYQISSPSSTAQIDPVYSTQLKNKEDTNTMIYQLNQEEQSVFGISATVLEAMAKSTKDAHTQVEPINKILTTSTQRIREFDTLINNFYSKLGTNILLIQDKSSQYIVLGFEILHGFFIASATVSLLFLVLVALTQARCFKVFTHILWNLVMIFCGLCLLIGSVLGILGTTSYHMIPVVNYIFSPQYLTSPQSIFGNLGEVATYLDVCLNKNGDLSGSLGLEVTKDTTQVLNSLYNSSVHIKEVKAKLTELGTDSVVITFILKEIAKWEQSIRSTLVPDLYSPEVKTAEANMKTCGFDYRFVLPEETCPSDSTCEKIDKDLPSHASDCPSADKVLLTLKHSVIDNQQKLNDAKALISNAHSDYKQLLANIISKVTETETMTQLLMSTLNPLIGDKSAFTDILNCSFFKNDIILFLDQLGSKLSFDSHMIALTCLGCSVFAFIAVLLFNSSINYLINRKKQIFNPITLNEMRNSNGTPLIIKC